MIAVGGSVMLGFFDADLEVVERNGFVFQKHFVLGYVEEEDWIR